MSIKNSNTSEINRSSFAQPVNSLIKFIINKSIIRLKYQPKAFICFNPSNSWVSYLFNEIMSKDLAQNLKEDWLEGIQKVVLS